MATRAVGISKINGVAIGELTLNLLGPSVVLEATYALCNVDNGDKFGKGTRRGPWSEDTHAALLTLLAAMERDICGDCFDGGEFKSTETEVEQALGSGAIVEPEPKSDIEVDSL